MTTEKAIQPSTDFSALIQAIRNTDTQLAIQAHRAVNISLTVRNYSRRQTYLCLCFYRFYPEILRSVTAQFKMLLLRGKAVPQIVQTPSALSSIPPDKGAIEHFQERQLRENKKL